MQLVPFPPLYQGSFAAGTTTDNGDGTYTFSYVATSNGQLLLQVLRGDTPLPTSQYKEVDASGNVIARPGDDATLLSGGTSYALASNGLPAIYDSTVYAVNSDGSQGALQQGVIVQLTPGPLTALNCSINGTGIKGGGSVGSVFTNSALSFNITAKDPYGQNKPNQDSDSLLFSSLQYLRDLNNLTTGLDPRNANYPSSYTEWTQDVNGTWTCAPPTCLNLINSPSGSAYWVPDPTTSPVIAASGYYTLSVYVNKYAAPCSPSCLTAGTLLSQTPLGSGQTLSPYLIQANPASSSSANSGLGSGSRRRLLSSSSTVADIVAVAGVTTSLKVQLRDALGNSQVPSDGRKLDSLSVTLGTLITSHGVVSPGGVTLWPRQVHVSAR